jgi:hypothetical protein
MCELDRYNSSDSVYVGERFGMFVDKPNGWVGATPRVRVSARQPRGSTSRSVLYFVTRGIAVRQYIGRSAVLRNGRDDADVGPAPLISCTLSPVCWLSPTLHPALLILRVTNQRSRSRGSYNYFTTGGGSYLSRETLRLILEAEDHGSVKCQGPGAPDDW